ncbi:MAG: hypothetical protein V9H69_09945 [Anaerolineae bacterium]
MFQQRGRDTLCLQQAGTAQTQRTIDHGRVVEDEVALAARGAVVVDQGDRRIDQPLRQLLRIGQSCGGGQEARNAAVEAAEALQPAQHIGHMAAEHPAVDMQLVQHHVAQPSQQFGPLGVVRQDAGVQHVRVAEDDTGLPADAGALALRGVAVVGGGPQRIVNCRLLIVN